MNTNWREFWDNKALAPNDFQATGRGLMDPLGFLYTIEEIVKLLNLQRGESLADIGCGSGLVALSLAPWLKEINGIDISPALILRAKRNLFGISNVNFNVGDFSDLPLESASTDKLLAYSVLQYLSGRESVLAAFKQIKRVLRDGGKALLAACPDPLKRLTYEEVVRKNQDKNDADKEISLCNHLLWTSKEEFLALANEVGLTVNIVPINPLIWQHFYMFNLVLTK